MMTGSKLQLTFHSKARTKWATIIPSHKEQSSDFLVASKKNETAVEHDPSGIIRDYLGSAWDH